MDTLLTRALVHFCQAYDDRNLRVAAEKLRISQPAITKSIQKLEEHAGVPLFLRRPDGMQPTRFADILRRHGQNMLNESRIVATEIAAMRETGTGTLRIGFGMSIVGTKMSSILSSCHRRFPNLTIEARSGVADRMLPLLERGEIDVWLGVLREPGLASEVVSEQTGTTTMHAFVRKNHPLAVIGTPDVRRLSEYRWALFQYDLQGIVDLEQALVAAGGTPPRVALTLSSVATSLRIVQETDLLLFGSQYLKEDAHRQGLECIQTDRVLSSYPIGISYRLESRDLTVTKFLIELCRTQLGPNNSETG